ncbi:MAG: T9SS type A sorting domain-containing protein, partial [Saprospiraceae bacterium]|nr:T9SS type A sorting domain-containing protein [Saprospiraceae bacterium]MCF8281394.1 T9SS type A sorting domain-containing protein [Bacteroidales bacterium]MCF8248171.1 T9SS type A sorting domain-containing protein [Saprospiraceae bacterium]MCF8249137.1 T9SS type A sorting domain-containing protein [Saprospiraceae bacterium]MCF8252860.1 T9SS type A sorting domain-containing protein [Saprospiraceae bacterium]
GTATLRIFDASGKLLHREVLANQHNQTNYGHLSAGIYFIEINNGKDVWRERLVVQ